MGCVFLKSGRGKSPMGSPLLISGNISRLPTKKPFSRQCLASLLPSTDRRPLMILRDGTVAAVRIGLTAYDAAYVDLALREGLPPATLDAQMRKAAERSGVAIFAQ